MRPQRLFVLAVAVVLLAACGSCGVGGLQERGAWVRTADSPLAPRQGATVAGAGSEIVVFGGDTLLCPPGADCFATEPKTFADGAAYNPADDTWRTIAPAPAGVYSADTVTVDGHLWVLATTADSTGRARLFSYSLSADTWTETDLPGPSEGGHLVATSDQVIVYSTSDEDQPGTDWLLDIGTGMWSELAEDPLGPASYRELVWDGADLYLFTKPLGASDGPLYLHAARLRNAAWETLPIADTIGGAPTLLDNNRLINPQLGCSDGGKLSGYGRCIAYGAVLDTATDDWVELPNAPRRGQKDVFSSGGISDQHLVAYSQGNPMFDAADNTWFMLPSLNEDRSFAQRQVHTASGRAFIFGGASYTEPNPQGALLGDSWIWHPQTTDK